MPESAPSSSVVASPEAVCSSAAPTSIPALSRAEVRELLFDLPWPELQALAHQCRLRHKGRHVHVRGLLEFSNVCRRNCRYCGLRHENRQLSRYSLSAAELLRAASQAVAAGVDTLVLQSGETARNPLWLAQMVRGLKERFGLPVTLSVSLHAPNDEVRDRIMPVNKAYPSEELLAACRRYYQATSRRISFEYAMIDGVNDRPEDAKELLRRLKGLPAHFNLIPLNHVEESPLKPSTRAAVAAFQKILEDGGVTATVRRTLGGDIDASCGQLRRKYNQSKEKR